MIVVKELTYEEKVKLYSKYSKKELIEMLIASGDVMAKPEIVMNYEDLINTTKHIF